MFKILVNATTLSNGGAYSVINTFIEDIRKSNLLKENNVKIDILVCREEFVNKSSYNLNIIFNDYPTKSKVKKIIFEKILIKKIIDTNNYDAYLSLQNLGLSKINIPQFVFIHTALPFADIKKRENYFKYWFILDRIYRKQIHSYQGIFVQTQWMANAIRDKYNYKGEIKVVKPLPLDVLNKVEETNIKVSKDSINLFYPTAKHKYKNNEFLIDSINECNKKNNNKNNNKKVMLYITLDGKSNEYIKYIGNVSYSSIINVYKIMDALVFPSLTESLGLPLQEAQLVGCNILAADLPYANEVCGKNAIYFDPRDNKELISILSRYCQINFNIKENYNSKDLCNDSNDYNELIKSVSNYLKK